MFFLHEAGASKTKQILQNKKIRLQSHSLKRISNMSKNIYIVYGRRCAFQTTNLEKKNEL